MRKVNSEYTYNKLHLEWAKQEANVLAHNIKTLDSPWEEFVIANLPRDMSNKGVLEIACGRGNLSVYLAAKCINFTCADFSQISIDITKEKMRQRGLSANVVKMDAQKTFFNDNQFDMIISCETLEHVHSPLDMLKEMYRILRPGGIFLLTTVNYSNIACFYRLYCIIIGKEFISGSGIQPVEQFFFFWKVNELLKKAGFKILKTEGACLQWALLPKINPMRLTTPKFKSVFLNYIFKPFMRHRFWILKK